MPTSTEAGLDGFIGRLREAGFDPTAEEVAEALWLARRQSVAAQGAAAPPPGGEEREAKGPSPRPPSGSVPPPAPDGGDEPPAHAGAERSAPVSLYAPGRHGDDAPPRAFAVRAPAASTLPGLLGLQRALRPLHGYRPQPVPVPGPLDEAATAELSARSAAVLPVFGAGARPDAQVLLLMDASTTTSVWQLTFDQLRQTCEQLGAFRDVQALYLHYAADGSPLIGTGPEPAATRLRPADQYRDTTGRQLTLVVSDCVGPLWQGGGAQRLLHRWSGSSPLAVVQPLPPRLWHRTALPAEPGTLVRDRGAGGRVEFQPDGYGAPQPDDALPVPVLLPTPAALGSWARLLGGNGRRAVRGAAAWVRPRHHVMPAPGTQDGAGPRELLGAFRASASPGALDLVVHLAAVPLVLPVIQLVQEAMLPDTGPMELAEVLLSGLLERLPDIEGSPGPRYAFAPGVAELLMQSLDQDAAVLVLKYLSEYVTRHFGKGTRNFPALAVARLSGHDAPEEQGEEWQENPETVSDDLFAQVPARVVRWYDPETAAPGGLAEAERLLNRWRALGDPRLLEEARAHAESALAAARSDGSGGEGDAEGEAGATRAADGETAATEQLTRTKLVLGKALRALTATGEVQRDPARARGLLHEAGRQLTGADPETRFELAAVQRDLWRAESDPRHLRAAVRTLRTMAEDADAAGSPLTGPLEARRRLWLGRLLLALGRLDGRTGAELRSFAAEAAAELRVAGDLLASAGADDRQLCGALLDLGTALRTAGAGSDERLANLDRARAAAGDDPALRLRCARARARVLRDAGDRQGADEAYAAAEAFAGRDSRERAELLGEWGRMLLESGTEVTRAEGLLREALTTAPSGDVLAHRLQLQLGRALVTRFEREGFLPDLYEGCHLLEQTARKAGDGELRAEAWLLLGGARQQFPAGHGPAERAQEAFTRSLTEARPHDDTPASVSAARALMGRGTFHERFARPREALEDYRAAAAEWQRLAGELREDIPWDEVRETRGRIAALEAE
ncbi:SAV_2336 N-terminal domain-related protein [Streptomyces ovatisporus]|uniref:SAV_2336 N-terminal domain-related protein n=1 Tax=Streptomyces ovatisporus TaxID=1128682 RepID=A0ABV9A202_9ACTN